MDRRWAWGRPGASAVGMHDDRGINELLGVDGVEEVSLYLLAKLGRLG